MTTSKNMLHFSFQCFYKKIFELPSFAPHETGGTVEVPAVPEEERPEEEEEAPKPAPEKYNELVQAYIHSLETNRQEEFAKAANLVRDREENRLYPAYTVEWMAIPYNGADFIETYFPQGEGKKELVDGLRTDLEKFEPTTSEYKNFQEARKGLEQIIELLNLKNEKTYEARSERKAVLGKEGNVDTYVKQGISNLLDNFKKGSGTDKAVMVGACAALFFVIKNYWGEKMPGAKKMTWGKMAGIGAALFSLNYISGKVSKDGKTFTERMGVRTTLDGIEKGSAWSLFALHGYDDDERKNESQESPTELETMFRLGTLDMAKILPVFERQSVLGEKKFNSGELREIGFSGKDAENVDGKTAFACVAKLTKLTGKNFAKQKRAAIARERGVKPEDIRLESVLNFEDPEHGITVLRKKYYSDETTQSKWTFEEIMMEEMRLEYPHMEQSSEYAMELFKKRQVTGQIKQAGIDVAGWTAETAVAGWEHTKDYARKGKDLFMDYWEKYYPKARRVVGIEALAVRGIESDFSSRISDELKAGEFSIQGEKEIVLRGIHFSLEKEESDGKTIYTIDGEKLELDDKKGNDPIIRKLLDKAVPERVKGLIKAADADGADKIDFSKHKLEWVGGKWVLRNFDLSGDTDLKIKAKKNQDIEVKINEDGTKATFELDNQEVKSFKNLGEAYRESKITKALFEAYPAFEGLDIDYRKIGKDASNVTITVTIGKREADKVKGISAKFDVPKGTKISSADIQGKLDTVTLDENFIDAKVEALAGDESFHQPFEGVFNEISGVSESIGDRLAHAWKEKNRQLWVLPNLEKAYTGRVVAQRMRYALDYKKAETLYIFRNQLKGKRVKELVDAQSKTLDETRKVLEQLQRDIHIERDPASKFPDYLKTVEHLNYMSSTVTKAFDEFRREIGKFDYAGLDNSDTMEEPHLIYTRLLSVWYYHVLSYFPDKIHDSSATFDANEETLLKDIGFQIASKLKEIQNGSTLGRISLDDLPDEEKEQGWADVKKALSNRHPSFKAR